LRAVCFNENTGSSRNKPEGRIRKFRVNSATVLYRSRSQRVSDAEALKVPKRLAGTEIQELWGKAHHFPFYFRDNTFECVAEVASSNHGRTIRFEECEKRLPCSDESLEQV
jgi:hypothetical protein